MSPGRILTINGGSSSVKFAMFSAGATPARTLSGRINRIGTEEAFLEAENAKGEPLGRRRIEAPDHARAAEALVDWLESQPDAGTVVAIGHRIVHGGIHLIDHQRVHAALIAELKKN